MAGMIRDRFNVILDELPDEWNGYRISSGFRIGIQITQLLENENYSMMERLAHATEMLFDDMPDTMEECIQGVRWFLSGWNYDRKGKERQDDIIVMDYDVDQWRIYAAFIRQYHIDLSCAQMHFWEFMGLLASLEECRFTRVMDIRTMKIDTKMSAKEKEAIRKAQEIYRITGELPEEERISPAREEFLRIAGLVK